MINEGSPMPANGIIFLLLFYLLMVGGPALDIYALISCVPDNYVDL